MRARLLALPILLAWFCCAATAQDPKQLSPEAIEAAANAVAVSTQIDAGLRAKIAPNYAAAVEAAKAAVTSKESAAAAMAAAAAAPAIVADKRSQLLVEPAPLPTSDYLATIELPRLEERLQLAVASRDQAKSELQAKEAEQQRRSVRLVALPGLIATARDEATKLKVTSLDVAGDPAPLVEARRVRRAAEQLALSAHADRLEAEKAQFEAEVDLLAVQRDLLDRDATRKARLAELLERAVQVSRREDAAANARKADAQAQAVHPLLTPLAEANQQLTASRKRWLGALEVVGADLKLAQDTRLDLESRFLEIGKRIEVAGRTDAIGLQLRQEKGKLPSVREYQARIEARRARLIAAQLEQLDDEDRRQRFQRERHAVLAKVLAALPAETPAATRDRIEAQGTDLLNRRDEFFASLGNDLQAYIAALVGLDTEERLLVQRSRFYANYVNERVLWIRSTSPVWATDWKVVTESAAWLLNGEGWRGVGNALATAMARSPVTFLLGSLVGVLLIVFRRSAKRRIASLAETAISNRATSFVPTVVAGLMTVVVASGVPLLLGHIASQVHGTPGIGEFPTVVAGGLLRTALLYWAMELFRQVMRPGGLAEAHLRWPVARTRLIRRNLAWFMPVVLLLTFMLRSLTLHGYAPWSFMLDRLVLVAVLLVISIFKARVLDPHKGALAGDGVGRSVGKRFWYWLGTALPGVLILVAVSGYHFTALELLYRLQASLAVVGLAVLVNALGFRWMLLAKRRWAVAQAKARRAAAKAKAKSAEGMDGQREPPQLVDESLSLASVDTQSRKLLSGGLLIALAVVLWGIWSDVLPALRILDSFKIWDDANEVTRVIDGKQVLETVLSPITWGNVLLALLVLSVTFAAARNIPGLLELVVLQKLRTHAGERYAVTTLVRYLIVTVGVIAAFSYVGIGWGKVQWLVAAVSVGLGFGLQEIFANFVSGIIILFERPIRIGDLVTVGDVTGYVSRIRMRATTIVDFDRRELIVPNKQFVTSQLVNWTLTDPITRVVVTVGVAYGSDTDLARKLLLQAAADNDLVLDEPAPSALFRKFGENSLDLDLRVFIASRDYWPQLVDSLHSTIDKAFREANIEIAFPQRDIHVRTLGPLAQDSGQAVRMAGVPDKGSD